LTPPSLEQRFAKIALETTARSVSASLSEYQKWLVAGIGAAVGLLLPKLHDLALLIGDARTVLVIALLCLAIAMSVISLLLGAQVLAGATVGPEMEKAAVAMAQTATQEPDVELIYAEMQRALWWPASWGFNYGRRAAARGDHVAPGRLIARLSQFQAYLVIGQVLIILATVMVAATAAL
jgi:hypothetical protein